MVSTDHWKHFIGANADRNHKSRMETQFIEPNAMSPKTGSRHAQTHAQALSRLLAFTLTMAWLVFLITAELISRPASAHDAQTKPHPWFTVPLPPARPTDQNGAPTTVQPPPAQANSAAPVEAPMLELPSQPRSLPPASRTRMHECGLEWQKMKQSGAAADKIWFDFAQLCLAK